MSTKPDNLGDWPFWVIFLGIFFLAILAGVLTYELTAYVAGLVPIAAVAYLPVPAAAVASVVALRQLLKGFSYFY